MKKKLSNAIATTFLSSIIIAPTNSLATVAFSAGNAGQMIDTNTLIGKTSNDPIQNGLAVFNTNNITFNNNAPITASSNDENGIFVLTATDIVFNGQINTNDNLHSGLRILNNASVTFNNTVNSNNNLVFVNGRNAGILIEHSVANFNNIVNTNNTIHIRESSSVNFRANIDAKEILIYDINQLNKTFVNFIGDLTIDSPIQTRFSGTGIIEFQGVNSTIVKQQIGSFRHLSSTTFKGLVAKSTIEKDIFSNNIVLSDKSETTFLGNVSSNEIRFTGNAKANFKDGIVFGVVTKTDNASQGNLNFAGSATINKSIGTTVTPLAKVEFAVNDQAKIVGLNADISANELMLGKATYRPANNITLTTNTGGATTHLNNPIFDLGTNTLNFAGNVVHDAPAGALVFNTIYDGAKIGHIEQKQTTFNMKNNITNVTINLTENAAVTFPKVGEIRNTNIFMENGGTITFPDAKNVTLNTTFNGTNTPHSDLLEWTYSDGKLTNRVREEFDDGVAVNIPLVANSDDEGSISFAGKSTVNQQIGSQGVKLNSATFSSPSPQIESASVINAPFYVNNVQVKNKANTIFNKDVLSLNTFVASSESKVECNGVFEGLINTKDNAKTTFNEIAKLTSEVEFAGNSKTIFNKAVSESNNGNSIIIARNDSETIFNDNLSTQRFDIADNAKIVFKKSVDMQVLAFASSQNSSVTISEGGILNTPIITKTASQGIVIVEGDTTINKTVGASITVGQEMFPAKPLQRITFSTEDPTKTFNVNANISAGEVFISNGRFTPADGILVESKNTATTHLNNPIFDLGSNTLKFSGAVVHDDPNGVVTINTTFDGVNAGHIEMTKAGDSINLTNSKDLVISINDAPMIPLPIEDQIREVDMFVENGGTLTLNAEATINNSNPFVTWTFNNITGVLSQKLVDQPVEVLEQIINNPAQNQNLENLTPETLTELLNIAANQGGAAANELIERLTNSDAVALATAPVNLAIQDATQVVSNRAERVSQPLQFISPIITASSDNNIIGVSAGDEIHKYGAWVSPFYGVSSQKSRNGQPGYKSSYYGGVIGVDSLINDRTALGVAFSYIKTDIKHKDQNIGDKTKADSFILSGYGTYEITKEWFVQSVATIGRSKIKNREIRTEFGATNIASADYNLTSWGAEMLTGYNQNITNNMMITPLFGLEFNRLNGFSYKETGTNTQNLKVKRKAKNQLEAILGARVSGVHALDGVLCGKGHILPLWAAGFDI